MQGWKGCFVDIALQHSFHPIVGPGPTASDELGEVNDRGGCTDGRAVQERIGSILTGHDMAAPEIEMRKNCWFVPKITSLFERGLGIREERACGAKPALGARFLANFSSQPALIEIE